MSCAVLVHCNVHIILYVRISTYIRTYVALVHVCTYVYMCLCLSGDCVRTYVSVYVHAVHDSSTCVCYMLL